MIDFNTFELNRLSKLLWSLKDYTTNNLRFPKAGELVEIAYDVYSKGQLKRVNLPGVDLIGTDGHTYESKVIQFKNVSKAAVRGVILKNSRASSSVNEKLADFFIFNPEEDHFFLHGYEESYNADYFAEAEEFDYQYVRSF